MKRVIRKFGLSLVPAMALAALFTACGEDGKNGVDGVPGEQGATGESGKSCSAKPLADGSGYTLTCETADGEVSYEVANGKSTYEIAVEAGFQGSEAEWLESLKGDKGDDGVGCEVSRNGYELTITCANSEEVVDLRDFIVEADPDVTPGTVPGSNSSTGEEDAAVVMPSGYYSNSSNCPAGLTCKYATNTDYLNSTKTYGEYLDTRDGQVYKTIKICDKNDENCQTWMAQNLNYAPDPEKVSSMGDYAWSGCYGDKNANCSKYGRLYTWKVAMDKAGCGYGNDCNNRYEGTQGVCPSGWHLPSNADWQRLVKPMGSGVNDNSYYWNYNGAGIELKTVDDWDSGFKKGTNASGFSALPAGRRDDGGDFDGAGDRAYFWSASESYDINAYYLYLGYNHDDAYLYSLNMSNAFSVRCVQN